MESNPYAAPLSVEQPPSLLTAEEEIRRAHINQENNIKSLGGLVVMGGVILVALGVAGMVYPGGDFGRGIQPLIAAAFGMTGVVIGVGLRRLTKWARIAETVMLATGLLSLNAGSVICVLFMWMLWTKKSSVVFSPAYKEVIRLTPHVKQKTSRVLLVMLAILAIVIGLFVLLAFIAGMKSQLGR